MIGLPFNDLRCLGSVTEVMNELVTHQDPILVELAAKHPTTESLAAYIRSLPQRDDNGDKDDGPKVETCEPPQRLRIPAEDPNCVERAALYIAAAELIDPHPIRQMATLDTPIGLHTFPVENGAPVILDPRLPRNCLDCGVALLTQSPVVIDPRDAIEWTAQLAEAGAANLRNGPSRVRRARNAIMQLVNEGAAPEDEETIDSIAWLLSLAESIARKHGPRAIAVVRTTAQAVADLADEALARAQRNVAWMPIIGMVAQNPWMSALAKIAGRVGVNVGAVALGAKLKSMGIDGNMVGLVEQELNREGMTMGPLASPTKLPTFEKMFNKSA